MTREESTVDSKYTAAAFIRNCGATTPFGAGVNIRETGERFSGDQVDEYVFFGEGEQRLDLEWITLRHLVIKCPSPFAKIYEQRGVWRDVTVTYVGCDR